MTDPRKMVNRHRDSVVDASVEKMLSGQEKYGDAWLDVEPEYLLRRMEEEYYEFRQAVEHDQDVEAAIGEMADVLNFGLMYLIRAQEEQ